MKDQIRTARPDDLDRLYEICVRTADDGGDATHLHGDPMLPGHVWAAPYLLHEPGHAFVVQDEAGAAGGYVIGAADSRAFERRLEEAWWPELRARYPRRASNRSPRDEATVAHIHQPPVAHDAVVATYPSHLHIDLLPEFQGRGVGRRMIDHLLDSLAAAGSVGVHLGVSATNERAIAFYRAVGFEELGGNRHGKIFGRRLA